MDNKHGHANNLITEIGSTPLNLLQRLNTTNDADDYILISEDNHATTLVQDYINIDEHDVKEAKAAMLSEAPARAYSPDDKPLLLACSGGGGHIAAIKAFFRFFNPENRHRYKPTPYKEKKYSLTGGSIFIAGYANYSTFVQNTTACLGLPVLPQHHKLSTAVTQLESEQDPEYVDVLLDYYDTGYESAGIWNVFQREDKTRELLKLVELQAHNDNIYHNDVSHKMFNTLKHAYDEGKPYTEVISTQAIGLPALCDAVKKYNKIYGANLTIHQYMTDLPSKGAVHFFNVLNNLSPEQQQQMVLYAVDLNQPILDQAFPQGSYFQHVYNLDPKNNPMIREGFLKPENDNSAKHHEQIVLTPQHDTLKIIQPHEKVATIMLGSQASMDTTRYMEILLDNGMDKIFVFGGTNHAIKDKRDRFIEARANEAYQHARDIGESEDQASKTKEETARKLTETIVLLDNQGDDFIASVMTRSNVIVTRAGGLSVMEQMAMNHPEGQVILIHHTDSDATELTSGIPWEDCNADLLIQYLEQKHPTISVQKTCPQNTNEQLGELLDDVKTREQEHVMIY